MTLLSELIEIPEQVHKSDFVISLATAIEEPERTVQDYVVTDQLAVCFDRALSLVATSLADRRSKAAYLHASFGAGKTAMMAMLDLLLRGDPTARSVPELGPVVARYASRLDSRRFLLVPYHFVGKNSMEQEILGGYVEYVRKLHPDAPLPPVYVADEMLEDARASARSSETSCSSRSSPKGRWPRHGASTGRAGTPSGSRRYWTQPRGQLNGTSWSGRCCGPTTERSRARRGRPPRASCRWTPAWTPSADMPRALVTTRWCFSSTSWSCGWRRAWATSPS